MSRFLPGQNSVRAICPGRTDSWDFPIYLTALVSDRMALRALTRSTLYRNRHAHQYGGWKNWTTTLSSYHQALSIVATLDDHANGRRLWPMNPLPAQLSTILVNVASNKVCEAPLPAFA